MYGQGPSLLERHRQDLRNPYRFVLYCTMYRGNVHDHTVTRCDVGIVVKIQLPHVNTSYGIPILMAKSIRRSRKSLLRM